MSAQQQPNQARSYRSPMKSWADRASVRAPIQHARPEDLIGKPFSAELFPIVRHPAVEAKGELVRDMLLARRALGYLDFTEELESRCVAPAAFMLARGEADLGLGLEFRRDIYKVGVDESHHAHEAFEVRVRIAEMAGIDPLAPSARSACLDLLERRLTGIPEKERPVVIAIFTAVSETLITSVLMQVPEDQTVMPLIRNKVAEHARDEARHHSVFTQVMDALWTGWTPKEKDHYAPYFAEFMHAFLAPPLADYWHWLRAVGFLDDIAEQIVLETHGECEIASSIRASAQASVREMRRLGMLQHAKLADSLGAAELI